MDAASFDALPATNISIELINGVVIYPHWSEDTMSPAPVPDHQDVVLNVDSL